MSRRCAFDLLGLALTAAIVPSVACAQTLTVQQPVVDVFNVSTVVSVPDRGSVLLGGVSRASEGSFTSGLSPIGSSLGLERSQGSAWASVYIHDLDALDAELLARPTARRQVSPTAMNPLAANAYRSLLRQQPAHTASVSREQPRTPVVVIPPPLAGSTSLTSSDKRPIPTAASAEATTSPTTSASAKQPTPNLPASRERFGRPRPPLANQVSSAPSVSLDAASRRSTNSSDSPAANRASR